MGAGGEQIGEKGSYINGTFDKHNYFRNTSDKLNNGWQSYF